MLGERLYSWLRAHEPLVDAGLALLLAGCGVVLGILVGAPAEYFLPSVLLALPLAVRRRWPVGATAAVLVIAVTQWLTVRNSVGLLPADLAVPMMVHACAAHGPRWSARAALAAGLAGATLGGVTWPTMPVPLWAHLLTGGFLACAVVAAWAIGELHRARRGHVAMLAERARLLEVEREQRDQLAVLSERTRIAREMHDVVAHSLAVVIAQADGGRYAAEDSPEAARTVLVTIADHARRALGETRRVLGVLRGDMPGLGDVPELVARVRTGGLDVRLTTQPPPGPVDPGLGLVAYRIVQEGLSNVLKHAGPTARAEVEVRWTPGQLEIDVRDNGTGTAPTTGGYGVLGMRERAAVYGGTVTLLPAPGSGLILSARIPVPS